MAQSVCISSDSSIWAFTPGVANVFWAMGRKSKGRSDDNLECKLAKKWEKITIIRNRMPKGRNGWGFLKMILGSLSCPPKSSSTIIKFCSQIYKNSDLVVKVWISLATRFGGLKNTLIADCCWYIDLVVCWPLSIVVGCITGYHGPAVCATDDCWILLGSYFLSCCNYHYAKLFFPIANPWKVKTLFEYLQYVPDNHRQAYLDSWNVRLMMTFSLRREKECARRGQTPRDTRFFFIANILYWMALHKTPAQPYSIIPLFGFYL